MLQSCMRMFWLIVEVDSIGGSKHHLCNYIENLDSVHSNALVRFYILQIILQLIVEKSIDRFSFGA